jgi:hypothetical protein
MEAGNRRNRSYYAGIFAGGKEIWKAPNSSPEVNSCGAGAFYHSVMRRIWSKGARKNGPSAFFDSPAFIP